MRIIAHLETDIASRSPNPRFSALTMLVALLHGETAVSPTPFLHPYQDVLF